MPAAWRLKATLKSILELPGLFNEVQKYMADLQKEKTVISNFTQGNLWKKKYSNLQQRVLPFFLYYDDFEPGNALGSHARQQELGGMNISLPFLPSHLIAKLSNIFVASIFYTKHRKIFGNKAS